jgi:hypothetical protein
MFFRRCLLQNLRYCSRQLLAIHIETRIVTRSAFRRASRFKSSGRSVPLDSEALSISRRTGITQFRG